MTIPPLPPERARPSDEKVCDQAFGKGSLCFAPVDAVRLGQLLAALTGVYLDRKACDTPSHAENQPPRDVANHPAVPRL